MNPKRPTARKSRRFRVGCAGWSIAGAHKPLFKPGASTLARYASLFDAVEINSSFYRPHQRKTYVRWAEDVPDDFRFSVKVPKAVTHDARLQGAGPMLDRFMDEVSGLGPKLSSLLVQFPPSLAFDARVAATFFAVLRRRWTGGIACEPRHASWFARPAETLWQRHRIHRVAADPALNEQAGLPGGEAGLRYWRMHGSPRMYYSNYDDDALALLAQSVRDTTPAGSEAWILFDNTTHSHATPNAAALRELLSKGA